MLASLRACSVAARSADVIEYPVEAVSRDVLHRVIADAAVFAEVEDGDDIRVVQPGGGACLTEEPSQICRMAAESRVHHLERNPASERLRSAS